MLVSTTTKTVNVQVHVVQSLKTGVHADMILQTLKSSCMINISVISWSCLRIIIQLGAMMCQWHVTDFRLESISPVNHHCFSSSCQFCFSFTVLLSKPVISEKHSIPRLKQLNQFPLTQANHNHLNHLQLSQRGYTEPKCLPPLADRILKFKKKKNYQGCCWVALNFYSTSKLKCIMQDTC